MIDPLDPVAPSTLTPRPGKQRDLLDGALRVFARDGYSRASIGAIGRGAGVSTRTIYNHYADKAALFQAVIVDSAERTARTQITTVRRLLGRVVDLDADLVEFGLAWASAERQSPAHFALVRQIAADVEHIPGPALAAWRAAGPLRVRAEIATHLRRLADEGRLSLEDESLAAQHLVLLTAPGGASAELTGPVDERERERVVRDGVAVFLAAYRGPGPGPGPGPDPGPNPD